MPVGGKLVLKGGLQVTSSGVEKKKKKKRKDKESSAGDDTGKAAAAITTQGEGTYEQVFSLEMEKARAGKVKNTPWGSSFRAPPQVLHGYDRKVKGKTAEERLDMRAAMKADKFCK
ncbi:hypothetical protein QBZ16_001560 [Prototheca wickerhamii]|uniref:Uncharacterized protein n=1 Tax=Prototheca wickerhamii TaxID=3111 RepID=A0AAD9IEW4_PROWI|nr:hypothetical protein QBZ16_001560 [Prototheca wickerhamii]